jgi:hypothetical protein
LVKIGPPKAGHAGMNDFPVDGNMGMEIREIKRSEPDILIAVEREEIVSPVAFDEVWMLGSPAMPAVVMRRFFPIYGDGKA